MERDLDIVVFGATGFVGRLIAAELATGDRDQQIALAGRNHDKLRSLADELGVDWPLLVADSSDDATLRAMAERTTVVLSVVGPYTDSGMALVDACVRAGTHYCDLTGEGVFVHDCIEAFEQRARTSGSAIVNASGFDSIPSDLGVEVVRQQAAADGKGTPIESVLTLVRMRGGFSGGTLATMRRQFELAAADPQRAALIADANALVPGAPPVRGSVLLERFERGFAAPFVMGPFNSQIVHRSDHLLRERDSRDRGERGATSETAALRHRERHGTGRGAAGLARAAGVACGIGVAGIALSTRALSPVLDRVLPGSGDGPSQAEREAGSFEVQLEVRTDTGARYRGTVADDRDPGYNGTAVMISESARELATRGRDRGGVLTPAAAHGPQLIERLRRRGFRLSCERLS